MRCAFCSKSVFGSTGITVPGLGSAHLECFQVNESMKRQFEGLNITELTDEKLEDLKNMVLTEYNHRNRVEDCDDVELF